ncbi:hypothetical protein [Arthrobacter sp. NA-172]|uniref:hypothetical protein n=1 Tax=Arthrobacter sp. NA-172 TaxID=3367524 RepID=UPI0037551EAE
MKITFRRHLAAASVAVSLLAVVTACSTTAPHSASGVVPANIAPAPTAGTQAGAVKKVHSPGIVAIDEQLTASQCSARVVDAALGQYLPDPACTPGATDPSITQDNIGSTICKSGYTATVRPPASATDKIKQESLREYGQNTVHTTEYDHLISLELGGTNSVSNLWPEPNQNGATGTTNPKDAVENTLHKAVCDQKVKLTDAQNAIAHDWVTALKDLGL